jgi:hypothetical protein
VFSKRKPIAVAGDSGNGNDVKHTTEEKIKV